jgi:hypothetical protein
MPATPTHELSSLTADTRQVLAHSAHAAHTLPAPFRCACALYVMKNWLPLVFGPLFAIDTTPRLLCFSVSTSSSGNLPFGVA